MVGRLLLEWHMKQALEFENKNKQFTQDEIFEDDQMVYDLLLQLIILIKFKVQIPMSLFSVETHLFHWTLRLTQVSRESSLK